MVDPDNPVLRTAVFGKQVEQFLESDIGSYLVGRAQEQGEAAIMELKDADPFDHDKIIKIQSRIKVAESIIGWLGDAIRAGHQAAEHIQEDA